MLARLSTYNFIGTTERMEESLVVLRNILGLSIKDILHLSAKMPGEVCAHAHLQVSSVNKHLKLGICNVFMRLPSLALAADRWTTKVTL